MKYLGENSLSSILSVFFKIAWYIVLGLSVAVVIFGFIFTMVTSIQDPNSLGNSDWDGFQSLPVFVKLLLLIYFGTLATLMLKIIKKSEQLFTNFKNSIVFNQSNVINTANIGMLMVWFAILTFDLGTLFVSLLLLMLCEIFKNGAALQEEHDLTV